MPGWHRAGVYSLGAVADRAEGAGVRASARGAVFLGTGPLLYLVASQYLKAGARRAGRARHRALADRRAAPAERSCGRPAVLRGLGCADAGSLHRAGVPVLDRGVEPSRPARRRRSGAARVAPRRRGRERASCDTVALGWHLRPETQLAGPRRAAPSLRASSAASGCRAWSRTGRPGQGVYLAGDGAACSAPMRRRPPAGSPRCAALERSRPGRVPARRRSRGLRRRRWPDWTASAAAWRSAFPWPARAGRAACRTRRWSAAARVVTAGELRERCGARSAQPRPTAPRPSAGSAWGAARAAIADTPAPRSWRRAAGVPVERPGGCAAQAPVKPLPMPRRGGGPASDAADTPSDVLVVGGGADRHVGGVLPARARPVGDAAGDAISSGRQASGTNFGNVRRQGRPLARLPLANRAARSGAAEGAASARIVESSEPGICASATAERAEVAGGFGGYARDVRPTSASSSSWSAAMRCASASPSSRPASWPARYSPRDGHANPRLSAPAFGRAAARRGGGDRGHRRSCRSEETCEDFVASRTPAGRLPRAGGAGHGGRLGRPPERPSASRCRSTPRGPRWR